MNTASDNNGLGLGPSDAATARELCAAVIPVWERHLHTAQEHTDRGVHILLQQFAELRRLLHPDTSAQAQAVMDGILTSFLFHDRVTQMLQLLDKDLQRMAQALSPAAPAELLSIAQWLQRLQADYVMAEQRHNHTSAGDDAPPSDETTYF